MGSPRTSGIREEGSPGYGDSKLSHPPSSRCSIFLPQRIIILPGRIRTHFVAVAALDSVHNGALKRAARAGGAGGTFWGTFVYGL
jgi:hypothetical protein